MTELRDVFSREREFNSEDIAVFYMVTKHQFSELRLTQTEWNIYFKSLLPLFSDEALKPFQQYFEVKRADNSVTPNHEAWDRFDTYFEESLSKTGDISFIKLSSQDRERAILAKLRPNLKPTVMKHVAHVLLVKGGVTSGKTEALYKFSDLIGLSKSLAREIMREIASSEEEHLKLINNLDQSARVYSYLYSVKSFLESGSILDKAEKKAINLLKKQFDLEFLAGNFWRAFINVLEGNSETLEFLESKDELIICFAAFNIIAFEDNNLDKQEAAFFKNNLKKFNIAEKELKKIKSFKDHTLDDLLGLLTKKAKVFLLIKSVELIMADSVTTGEEKEALRVLLRNIIDDSSEIGPSEDLYLYFLNFIIGSSHKFNKRDLDFLKVINNHLIQLANFDRDLEKTFYLMKIFNDPRGNSLEAQQLEKALSILDFDDYTAKSIAKDCLASSGEKRTKAHMLLSFLKTDILVNDTNLDENFVESVKKMLEGFDPPGTSEKNAIAYFALKSILLDLNIDDKEVEFFEDLAYSMKVDQSLIHKFIGYLYLETSIKYEFAGWLDYSEFLENRLGKSRFYRSMAKPLS